MRIVFSLSWLKNWKSVVWMTGVGTVLAQATVPPVDPPQAPQAPMPVRLPEIEVTAPYEAAVPAAPLPAGAPLNTYRAATSAPQRERVPDSATFLQSVPGAAVVRNGPQTGIVQLRGLSGDRVKVSVDGANITPACPNHMDPPLHYAAPTAVEAMTVMAGVKHDGQYAFGMLAARFYYHTIDHLMDNYSLRPALPGGMRMFSPATSTDTGGRVGVTLPRDTHTFLLGAEGYLNWFEACQQNAVTGAQQDTLPKAHRYRVGAYAEWQADWDERWTTLLGLRHDSVLTDAGKVQRFFPPAAADAARFNARDPAAHEPNTTS